MNFEPPPNHGTDAQDEDFELVDGYLLRVRHRAILPQFGSFISPKNNRSRRPVVRSQIAVAPKPETVHVHPNGELLAISTQTSGKEIISSPLSLMTLDRGVHQVLVAR